MRRGRPSRPRSTARAVAWACAVLLAMATACGSGDGGTTAGTTTPVPPETYVAIGGSETVGMGADNPVVESWPQVLYRTALDRNTVFVNLAVGGASIQQALEEQVPMALELRPTLVTVWLNANDLLAGVPPAAYEQQLTELVRALGHDGRAHVLLANTLPVDQLPAAGSLGDAVLLPPGSPGDVVAAPAPPEETAALVTEYNQAVERVADAEGADVVDLHTAFGEAAEDGSLVSLVSEDGFHPSTEGHAAIADLFAAAL